MQELKINGIYKHFKGDYYLVEGVATHSETREKYVLYRGLYGEQELYIRPYDMFLSEVDHKKYQMSTKNIDLNCKKSKVKQKNKKLLLKLESYKKGEM